MTELFGRPDLVWALLAPLLVVLLAWHLARRRRDILARLAPGAAAAVIVGVSPRRRLAKTGLRVLAAAAIALALMRPQWGEREVQIVRRGIDVVIAVDVSRSMLAEDVQPNRIGRVKQDVRYFVERVLDDDRIALVAFAGEARTLCPLTLDYGAFQIFLEDLGVGSVSAGGTDLAAALDASLGAFGDDERNYKAIILFSDGEGHASFPKEQLERARERGVRVYTVGIGSAEGVRIPLREADGTVTYLSDESGNIVLTRLDEDMLRRIAHASDDGAYGHLASGRAGLERIYADNLAKIEDRELKSRAEARRIERFPWFLAVALAALAADALIGESIRRKRRVEGAMA